MAQTSEMLRGAKGIGIAHQTIDLMGEHAVAPAPQNYEVWLSYRLGGSPELRTLLEERISKGIPFDDQFNDQIYERFFSNVRLSAQMAATGEKIARELAEVVSALHAAGERTGEYGQTLERAANHLEQGLDESRLREIILSLATATLDMAEHNRALNDRLHRSTQDMEALRSTLKHARAEALTDGLTGLANRKMFDETLKRRVAEANEDHSPLCLMLCDIDFFKRFNDTWGHQTGDQIIRFIASTLQKHARTEHLVARYGGEEFAIIMPRTTLAQAKALAESLRGTIECKKLLRKSTNEDLGCVTISGGIALLRPNETPTSLVERADVCLYASKRNGRNRMTLDTDKPAQTAEPAAPLAR